uniref:site-specific DNA-methyltransferase (cytosine-N(4)-specific) n=1 Tax=viral metagenome TaxID=1070528 RepID=A0A6M3LES1_9ZZZZ
MKPYYETKLGKLYHGNVSDVLPQLESESVQMCVTSPPYWGLRDYGVDGQFGLEKTPEEYTEKMVQVFREVKRVLRGDGTLWLNLGDSYAGGGTGGHIDNKASVIEKAPSHNVVKTLKPKDLCGIPWRVAFALQADGWYLRQDIIWHKPNPMPESVKDRCTKAHEYMFLMSKNGRYYYDADAVREADNPDGRKQTVRKQTNRYNDNMLNTFQDQEHERWTGSRNRRSVWRIPTHSYSEAHFATFPPKLIEPCIFAGSREGDVVLDPFGGACTTPLVCEKYSRRWVAAEISEEYCEISAKRIESEASQLKLWG